VYNDGIIEVQLSLKPKVFINSIPKAGAHLVVKALELVGLTQGTRSIGSATVIGRHQAIKMFLRGPRLGSDVVVVGIELPAPVRAAWIRRRLGGIESGQFSRGHVRFTEYFAHLLESGGLRTIHVIRDPRDVAVSHAHYMLARPRHPFHRHYRELGDWSSRLAFSITGGPVPGVGYLASLGARYRLMEGWARDPQVLQVRFEDLVGSGGGGKDDLQRETIAQILQFVEREPTEEIVGRTVENLFGGTSTFREGQIGSWQDGFEPVHKELFQSLADDLLERWGYTRWPE
jgi:hypothetical protein